MSEPDRRATDPSGLRLRGWTPFALFLAVLVLGLALWFAWSRGDPTPPKRPTVTIGAAPAQAVGGSDLATSSGSSPERSGETLERARSDVVPPGIHGRLLDSAGEPLAGFELRASFQRPGEEETSRPEDAAALESPARNLLLSQRTGWGPEFHKQVRTGPDGSFSFAVSKSGDYVLSTVPFGAARRAVRFDAGERVVQDFRLRADEVATIGAWTRRGKQQRSVLLGFGRGESMRIAQPHEGEFRVVFPAGSHRLLACNPSMGRGDRVVVDSLQLALPRGTSRREWRHSVRCGDLLVEVRNDVGGVPADADVTLRRAHGEANEPSLTFALGESGRITFVLLPPGDYEVSVAGDDLVAVVPQIVTMPKQDRRERVPFTVSKGAKVRLLVDADGKGSDAFLGLPPESMPVLASGRVEIPFGKLTGRGGRYTNFQYGYEKVPLGRATLAVQDRIVDGEHRFLAFDPIPEQYVEVLDGHDSVLRIRVAMRASVYLRACETGGREQLGATIEVFRGDRKVHSGDAGGCQRFRSYLPPGDYRVVIDRGGKIREHALHVGRRNINLRLRP